MDALSGVWSGAAGEGLADADAARVFVGESEMAARCRAFDWAATPLGPVEQWPAALRTGVRLMLAAPVPTVLYCGPSYTLLYNDAYRPILGVKHPDALGRPIAEVWSEVWPVIGPQLAQVRDGGPPVYAEEALYRVERLGGGRAEDAWFTYAFSALTDERGECLAVHHVAFEVTGAVRSRQALAVERARLEGVFRRSPSFLAVLRGPDDVFELANDAYYDFIGRGRDILGKPLFEALPEVRSQGFEANHRRVRETGEPLVVRDLRVMIARTPGAPPEERFMDVTYLPLVEPDGSHEAIIAHGADVTEQVRARREVERLLAESEAANAQLQDQALELELANQQLQETAVELEAQTEELQATAEELAERTAAAERAAAALAASEGRLRVALEAARMVAWEWDPAADGITTTENLRDVYGVDALADSAAGFALVHPDDRARHQAAVAAAVERNEGYRSEFRITRPDTGATVWLEEYGHALRGSDGRLTKVVGVVMDVTARKWAELAREEHERQLRTLADAIPTLAWTARADGYIDWYNARWYEYTGTAAEQMEGWGWQSVHDPAVLPDVMARWQASITTGAPFEMTFPLRGADGRFRRFLTRVTPHKDADGRVVRWFGTNTDVEAERRAREAAEGANQAKTDFLATMSHELRTPLNAIAGYAELLEIGIHGPVTDQQREAISRIQRSQRHLLSLINDVLNFAKLEAGRVEYAVADVTVSRAVDALEPMVAPQLRAKALRFDRARCTERCVVRADPDKLQQILLNLLSNAIKFTPAGGAVVLRCEALDNAVAVAVEDTGIGIAPDRLDHVFAPFVQIDRRLNAPHEGTGLGLAISRDLARGMGGDLTAESTPGAGSVFTLTLPRA